MFLILILVFIEYCWFFFQFFLSISCRVFNTTIGFQLLTKSNKLLTIDHLYCIITCKMTDGYNLDSFISCALFIREVQTLIIIHVHVIRLIFFNSEHTLLYNIPFIDSFVTEHLLYRGGDFLILLHDHHTHNIINYANFSQAHFHFFFVWNL